MHIPSVYSHPLRCLWRAFATQPTRASNARSAWLYVDAVTRDEARKKLRDVAVLLWGPPSDDVDVENCFEALRSFTELEQEGLSASAVLRTLEVGSHGDTPTYLGCGDSAVFVTNNAGVLHDAMACVRQANGQAGAFTSFSTVPRKAFDVLKASNDQLLCSIYDDRFHRNIWGFDGASLPVHAGYDRITTIFGRPYKQWGGNPGTFWPIRFADGATTILAADRITSLTRAKRGIEEPWVLLSAGGRDFQDDPTAALRVQMLLAEPRVPAQAPAAVEV